MKELSRLPCHKYDVNYMIMQKHNGNDGVCHNKWNSEKLHGNISRNGYGNAIIGVAVFRKVYGGCYGTGRSCAAQERLAIVEG